jgi:hypothetical protein
MMEEFRNNDQKERKQDQTEENPEAVKKESFWKSFSKILCSLAVFNAINKHY